MTGGGSGGHITPILAVAHELKAAHPDCTIIYIGQKGDVFGDVVAAHELIDEVHLISAGKFRRYHGEGWRQLLDFHAMYLNIRDAFRVIIGFIQSIRLLGHLKPDVVFCKGGFVGVPVGLAAALRHVPYVTHDSDAIPGLANRIIARWARLHAVALESTLYPYSSENTVNVGVPVAASYRLVAAKDRQSAKAELELTSYENVVLVTGGGLGAARLNQAVIHIAPALLKRYPSLALVHTTGGTHEATVNLAYTAVLDQEARKRVLVIGYTTKLQEYSAAADVVVARGGATSFAELATQAKAAIIVPNPLLTGGHQLKNAKAYAEKHAVVVVDEGQLVRNHELLQTALYRLLDDSSKRQALAKHIHTFARPHAAEELATIIYGVGEGSYGEEA